MLFLERPIRVGPRATQRFAPEWRGRICAAAGIAVLCVSVGAVASRAQDVGQAAREERARKEKAPKRAKKVYTEQDLKRAKILTEEDRARFEASRQTTPAIKAEKSPAPAADPSQAQQPSLGEIARQYRRQKQERQAQESARARYPMNSTPLASPAPPVALALRPPVAKSPLPLGVRPVSPSARPTPAIRLRSPFARPALRSVAPPRPVEPIVQPVAPPALEGLRAVKIQPGDSLWKLARKSLGRGSRWPELLAVNPRIADPNRLVAGSEIVLPTAKSPAVASRIHVQTGDTLWGIAQARYGTGMAWPCVAVANPQLRDPGRIFPGQALALPASCKP